MALQYGILEVILIHLAEIFPGQIRLSFLNHTAEAGGGFDDFASYYIKFSIAPEDPLRFASLQKGIQNLLGPACRGHGRSRGVWYSGTSQSAINHQVHLLYDDEKITNMGCPTKTQTYPKQQPSSETKDPLDLSFFGETVRAPLGYVVLGRSGDKASDANAGFFVRHDDEWDWLRSMLTIKKIIELLGPEEYKGKPIDRFEMPKIRAVQFLLQDHLDRGYNACSTYDTLGKNCMEYLRAQTVDIPKKLLDRGRV